MGAIDLVVQIEAPPSVASGLQRIGRGGHQVDAVSEGVIFPKFRGDLVACAAVAQGDARRRGRSDPLSAQPARHRRAADRRDGVDGRLGRRRAVRDHPPRGAVRRAEPHGLRRRARHAVGPLSVRRVRRAAPARHLGPRRRHRSPRAKAPSAWRSPTAARFPTAGSTACSSLGAGPGAARVGELDEEMVFESRVGETFVLGASSWRIEEITHDRVLVSPAPGEPGKMPFWKGDRAGRPLELGLAIGRLMHDLLRLPPAAAVDRLTREHDLDAARRREPAAVPARSDGGRRAPCPTRAPSSSSACATSSATGASACCRRAAGAFTRRGRWRSAAKIREETGVDVETLWGDDGFVVRFPDVDQPPDAAAAAAGSRRSPGAGRAAARRDGALRREVPRERGAVAAAAEAPPGHARAAVAAAQARGRPAGRGVALRIVSGAARDLSRVPARLLRHAGARSRRWPTSAAGRSASPPSIPRRRRRLRRRCSSATSPASSTTATRRWPSGARRRSPSIRRSCASCSATRSCASCSTPTSMEAIERQLQRLDPQYQREERRRACTTCCWRSATSTDAEICARARSAPTSPPASTRSSRRAACCAVRIAGEPRFIAVEDAARYRDALGVPLPPGIPESLLQPVARSARRSGAALRAHARAVHRAPSFAARYGLAAPAAEAVLLRLTGEGRLLEGEFRPGGTRREWTDAGVLRMLRRRSLAKLRHEIEPVDQAVLGRFVTTWQGDRQAAARRRRAARRDRAAAGRAAAGVDPRDRDPAGADRRLRSGGSRRGHRGRRGRLGRRRAARRARRPRRAVSRRSSAAAAAAGSHVVAPACKRGPTADGRDSRPASDRETAILEYAAIARRVVLRPAARSGRRRLSRRDRRRALESRLAGPRHQRHVPRAARVHARARAAAAATARRDDVSAFRSRRLAPPSAEGRWALVPSARRHERVGRSRSRATRDANGPRR